MKYSPVQGQHLDNTLPAALQDLLVALEYTQELSPTFVTELLREVDLPPQVSDDLLAALEYAGELSPALAVEILRGADPLPRAVQDLLNSVQRAGVITPSRATALLAAADLNPLALARWQALTHPLEQSYGRRVIARMPHFELQMLSWAPGDYSAIHDYGGAEWGAVRHFGAADRVLFDLSDNHLSIRERRNTRYNEVTPIEPGQIELTGNRSARPLFSLLLIGRNEVGPAPDAEVRIFDLFQGCVQRSDGDFHVPLAAPPIGAPREPAPSADGETRLLHHQLLLDRIERLLALRSGDATLKRRHQALQVLVRTLSRDLEHRPVSSTPAHPPRPTGHAVAGVMC